MKRKEGYYWVKMPEDDINPGWKVALWHDNDGGFDGGDWCWHSTAFDTKHYDNFFEKINENRIPPPYEDYEIKDYITHYTSSEDSPPVIYGAITRGPLSYSPNPYAKEIVEHMKSEEPAKEVVIMKRLSLGISSGIIEGIEGYILPAAKATGPLSTKPSDISFTRIADLVHGATKADIVMGIAIGDCKKGEIAQVITKGFIKQ